MALSGSATVTLHYMEIKRLMAVTGSGEAAVTMYSMAITSPDISPIGSSGDLISRLSFGFTTTRLADWYDTLCPMSASNKSIRYSVETIFFQ